MKCEDKVPGFEEDGAMWYDTPDVVTINMPVSDDELRSLTVHTDGSTLSLSWGGGSVVFKLFAPVIESRTGPARVKKGMFSLPMRKAKPMMWPSLFKRDVVEAETSAEAETSVIGFSSVSANLGNLLSCNDEPNDNEQERKRPEAERFNFTRADGLASFSHGTKRAVDFSSGNSEWENGGDGGVGGDGLEPSQFQYAPIVQLATVPQEVFHCAFNPVQPNMVGFVSNDGKAFVYRLLEGGSSKLLQEIRHSDRNTKCLEFSPDGGLLAVGGASKKKGAGYKGQVGLYEVAGSGNAVWTKQMMMCDEDNSIFDVSFSPCGRFVAYGGYKDVPLRVHRIRDDALTLLAEVW